MDSQMTAVLKNVVNDDFALISTVTFFVCEAVFAAFPIKQARMKQLTSLAIGGALGFFLLATLPPLDATLQGLLAGGATTIVVAKFKKPSTSSLVEAVTEQAIAAPAPVLPPAEPEPTPVPSPLATASVTQGSAEHL